MASTQKKQVYKFRAHDNIGAMSAEKDNVFLETCFIETDDFKILKDFSSPKSILLGRTGAGKSAFLIHLKNTQEHVISIEPDTLALNYIANSDILKFFSQMGVNLDIFYKLLWQHVICVELLKYKFEMNNENDFKKFKDWIRSKINKNKSQEIALEYLEKWSPKFWAETEERIKEITKNLEKKIIASSELNQYGIEAKLSAISGIDKEVKSEILYKSQSVVDSVQIQHLSKVIELLSEEVFTNEQQKYFLTIDHLDDNWIEDKMRCKLIRALIDATTKFRKIQNVKIIIALRVDLLERVYRTTQDIGFQEEKYSDINVPIVWTQEQLKEVVNKRIDLLLRQPYTKETITFDTIFPNKIKDKNPFEYIIQRTLMRPRDIIDFINTILEHATGKNSISTKTILESERNYSENRKKAVFYEWRGIYPKLEIHASLLQNMPQSFKLDEITDNAIDDYLIELMDEENENSPVEKFARKMFNQGNDLNYLKIKKELITIFFKVGFIGIKVDPSHPWAFVSNRNAVFNQSQINETIKIKIHPMFQWAFGSTKKLKGEIINKVITG